MVTGVAYYPELDGEGTTLQLVSQYIPTDMPKAIS